MEKTDISIRHDGAKWVAEKDGKVVASDESYVILIATLNALKQQGKL